MSDTLPDLIITGEQQLKAIEAWRRLARGECTIDEAMFECMFAGAPIPPPMVQRYQAAWSRYNKEGGDLAEMLGHRVTDRHRQHVNRLRRENEVFRAVEDARRKGFRLTSSRHQRTAFDEAMGDLKGLPPLLRVLSPATAADIYKAAKRRRKSG